MNYKELYIEGKLGLDSWGGQGEKKRNPDLRPMNSKFEIKNLCQFAHTTFSENSAQSQRRNGVIDV